MDFATLPVLQQLVSSPIQILPISQFVKKNENVSQSQSGESSCPFNCCQLQLERKLFGDQEAEKTLIKMRIGIDPEGRSGSGSVILPGREGNIPRVPGFLHKRTLFEGRVPGPVRFDELIRQQGGEGDQEIMLMDRTKKSSNKGYLGLGQFYPYGQGQVPLIQSEEEWNKVVEKGNKWTNGQMEVTPMTMAVTSGSGHGHGQLGQHGQKGRLGSVGSSFGQGECRIPVIEMKAYASSQQNQISQSQSSDLMNEQLSNHLKSLKYVKPGQGGIINKAGNFPPATTIADYNATIAKIQHRSERNVKVPHQAYGSSPSPSPKSKQIAIAISNKGKQTQPVYPFSNSSNISKGQMEQIGWEHYYGGIPPYHPHYGGVSERPVNVQIGSHPHPSYPYNLAYQGQGQVQGQGQGHEWERQGLVPNHNLWGRGRDHLPLPPEYNYNLLQLQQQQQQLAGLNPNDFRAQQAQVLQMYGNANGSNSNSNISNTAGSFQMNYNHNHNPHYPARRPSASTSTSTSTITSASASQQFDKLRKYHPYSRQGDQGQDRGSGNARSEISLHKVPSTPSSTPQVNVNYSNWYEFPALPKSISKKPDQELMKAPKQKALDSSGETSSLEIELTRTDNVQTSSSKFVTVAARKEYVDLTGDGGENGKSTVIQKVPLLSQEEGRKSSEMKGFERIEKDPRSGSGSGSMPTDLTFANAKEKIASGQSKEKDEGSGPTPPKRSLSTGSSASPVISDVAGYDHIVLLDKRRMTYMCKRCLETLKSDQDIRNHLFCKMLHNSIQCHVCRNIFSSEEYSEHLKGHGVRAYSN